ncbi:hypothetical protein CDD83_6881 [Cordyceps sp. RAO-2017]|nr:hypothetical protein CDD83_6881 [Cordyceps sp. RAO-2017]
MQLKISRLLSLGAKRGGSRRTTAPPRKTMRCTWAPAKMVGLLLLGIAFAIGHHFFNRRLDSTPVDTKAIQEWVGRVGLAFAFLTKALLVGAVIMAYKQHVWTDFRLQA